MAGEKEIRTKVQSVKNTQKITRAMEMVAASKMRKAQDRMTAARPYADKIRRVIAHLSAAKAEYVHPFMVEREAKGVGYIVISTDRGLCGGLNSNVFRNMLGEIDQNRAEGLEMEFCCIGGRGANFFRRLGMNIVAQASHLGDQPTIDSLIGTVKVMLDSYLEERIDRVHLVYSAFVNSMTQKPVVEQILPRPAAEDEEVSHHWDYIYEPDAQEVLDELLTRYIESLVYQAVIENVASEQAARMVAMKAATDNAGNLIDELQLAYNKARQAAITQELTEIVSGAAAV